MKNFSDLLDTDSRINVKVCLFAITNNGYPCCKVIINNLTQYDGPIAGSMTLECAVELIDPIKIEIMMSDKNYSAEKETAILIDSVNIDGFEIVPNWTHLAHYDNEKFINEPTSYLGFNGTWLLAINEPFYRWQHRITGQGWLLEPTHNISS